MNAQVRRIAESNFRELWNMGWTRSELADHYCVQYSTINKVVEYMDLPPVLKADLAQTPDEDRASRESLRLAPMVAEKARAHWEKHLEARRNESESATQTRQDVTYRVYLSNGRVLQ